MFKYTTADGSTIPASAPFTLNDITYSATWLDLASEEALSALGITKSVIEEPTPDPEPEIPQVSNVPNKVSQYQARMALVNAGLYDAVEAAVAVASVQLKIAWEYATIIERNSPLIASISPALGLTEAQVDALFIAADQIT